MTTTVSVPWWRTDLGDAEATATAQSIRSRHINQGPVTAALESELSALLDGAGVVATTSGSAAIALAMLASGVGPGTHVVLPAVGFIATAHAALLLGAQVRLVDVRRDRPLIDPAAAEAAICARTRAIVAVHLNGAACDMNALGEITRRHGIALIEDAAQAFCSHSDGRALGTFGNGGAFSM